MAARLEGDLRGTADYTIDDVDCLDDDTCLGKLTATIHVTDSPLFVGDISISASEVWVDNRVGSSSGCSSGGFPIPSK
jgi:hypothetical protein